MPSSLLWHAIFSHTNYENLCLLKNNGFSGFPTIPKKLKQCDACFLGKHRKQPFHDSTSKACRKLELIHSDLCGSMLVGCTCWKINHKLLKLLKIFIYGFKMKLCLILYLFILIMQNNIHLMNLKVTFTNMRSRIKPRFHTILNRMV